jgi:hypothetical protein
MFYDDAKAPQAKRRVSLWKYEPAMPEFVDCRRTGTLITSCCTF